MRRHHAEAGASSVEYGVLVSLIAAAVVGMIFTLGQTSAGTYRDSCTRITETMGSACAR